MKRQRKNAARRSIVLNSLKLFVVENSKRVRRSAQVGFVALVIVISYIAFLPNYDDLPEFTTISDVINHFAAFFVLSLFLEMGFSPKQNVAFLILFLYGFFIEAVQHFLPNRVFDLMDIAVDMIGVGSFYALSLLLKSALKSK